MKGNRKWLIALLAAATGVIGVLAPPHVAEALSEAVYLLVGGPTGEPLDVPAGDPKR